MSTLKTIPGVSAETELLTNDGWLQTKKVFELVSNPYGKNKGIKIAQWCRDGDINFAVPIINRVEGPVNSRQLYLKFPNGNKDRIAEVCGDVCLATDAPPDSPNRSLLFAGFAAHGERALSDRERLMLILAVKNKKKEIKYSNGRYGDKLIKLELDKELLVDRLKDLLNRMGISYKVKKHIFRKKHSVCFDSRNYQPSDLKWKIIEVPLEYRHNLWAKDFILETASWAGHSVNFDSLCLGQEIGELMGPFIQSLSALCGMRVEYGRSFAHLKIFRGESSKIDMNFLEIDKAKPNRGNFYNITIPTGMFVTRHTNSYHEKTVVIIGSEVESVYGTKEES